MSEKLFQKPFSMRSRDQRVGLFIMIICFLTKPGFGRLKEGQHKDSNVIKLFGAGKDGNKIKNTFKIQILVLWPIF